MNELLKNYFEGALDATIGSRFINASVPESFIDALEEATSKFRESQIDGLRGLEEKEKILLKEQVKRNLKSYTKGFKDTLKKDGKLK